MTRIFLRALNAPGLILLVAIAVALQTSIFAAPSIRFLQPDIVLLAVIWFALKRDFTEGGILTLIAGDIAEVHSGAPQGVLLLTYMLIYLVLRLATKVISINRSSSLMVFTMAATVLWKLVCLLEISLLIPGTEQWRHTLVLISPSAVINALLVVWVFKGLGRYDWVTYKSPQAQQMLEDELLLEGEGI